MNAEVENHIRQNHAWNKLPANVKQVTSCFSNFLSRQTMYFNSKHSNFLEFQRWQLSFHARIQNFFYDGVLAADQGASNKILPFQNLCPGKIEVCEAEGVGGLEPCFPPLHYCLL